MSALFMSGVWTVVGVALVVSGISPYERNTWWMEVAPVVLVVPVLWCSRQRFPLTPMLMGLIALHALVLIVGGAYTYARVPFGFWMQDVLHLSRNPYDKIGHFMQGFVPALAAREVLIRRSWVVRSDVAGVLALCVAMTISALYELVEWWAALALGQGAEAFLGTQGDVWDTQSDMFFALIGALVAMAFFARMQDEQIRRME
ncbi:Inner membrane protein YjdF [Ephemeroptericola cinctiostellae]|uniref:Inner membrane protein YjdF n=1 Tax=Ephemeroptericola cinctiostellae TaxID=2268024 RepID=A0A345D7N0_9BURK|nr:DUF2238 domain-containing protein [Ephemeroptericola cinctiostellae]AXF84368.1 Inner membrane protein YjdF [Ephemeroptericola cinctiostellae]